MLHIFDILFVQYAVRFYIQMFLKHLGQLNV